MTDERITAIYQRLDHLNLLVDLAPERGPKYLLEMLTECRRRQDETVTLLVEVRRARVQAKRAIRALREESELTPDAVTKARLRRETADATDSYDELAVLESCVNLLRANLRVADSDIRLAEKLMEQQRQLGTIKAPPATVDAPVTDSIFGTVDLGGGIAQAGPEGPSGVTASASDVASFLNGETPAAAPSHTPEMTAEDLVTWIRSGK